ncbi:hypothetical protein SAY87_028387 [Trapa incisa]|uniref:Hexosyltransferase n=1 Tax=Trapa incisa TaxID=236973 RepID=A0AAN7KP84_9MYRT|nr:hypothetical protein SAY87_028387 [Trapa incisa]
MMRRRAADFRRPVRRRWSRRWIWALLGFFAMGFILFFVHHYHHVGLAPPLVLERSVSARREAHANSKFFDKAVRSASFSQRLAEQITLAKAYVVISKERNNLHLAWELSSKIRVSQLLLSKAAMRGEDIKLAEVEPIIKSLSSLLFKAEGLHYDIAITIVTMKSHMQALEQRISSATAQSMVFGQLVAEHVPKSLHCLSLKLMSSWLKDPYMKEHINRRKLYSAPLVDNSLHHFCIFSDNVLAASVVINSTVSNSNSPKDLVFHIVTDSINYGAMLVWFNSNDFRGSTIEVRNMQDLSWLNASYSLTVGSEVVKDDLSRLQNPKDTWLLLNHLRFYIADIYPELEKVIYLEDDVVVKKDLVPLFSLDLHGSVNGAVETCLESFNRYYKYLNFSNPIVSSNIDPQSCGWAFGMNVFDLVAWRKANVTARYHFWIEMNSNHTIWRSSTLPAGLLAFYGLTEPLDRRWHVLGLGHDVNINDLLLDSAAVVHFNGNLKPWLEIGISRYKPMWERYLNKAHPYLRECAVN